MIDTKQLIDRVIHSVNNSLIYKITEIVYSCLGFKDHYGEIRPLDSGDLLEKIRTSEKYNELVDSLTSDFVNKVKLTKSAKNRIVSNILIDVEEDVLKRAYDIIYNRVVDKSIEEILNDPKIVELIKNKQ